VFDDVGDVEDGAVVGGISALVDMKKCPPALLLAFGSHK
jgi:hypothetical protein